MKASTTTLLLSCLSLVGCATPPSQPQSIAELAAVNRAREAPPEPGGGPDRADGTPAADADPAATRVAPVLYPGTDRVLRDPGAREPVAVTGDAVTLRFERAPLKEVVHAILGDLLGLDYVLMQPLDGEVSLHTHRPVPRDQLLGILESMLQSNGYVIQADADGRFAIGERDGMRANVPMASLPGVLPNGYGSVIVPLRYVGATEMADILRPVSGAENLLRIDTTRNLLMLAGTRNQLDGWLEMVNIFDVDFMRGMSIGLFPLNYLSVGEAELALKSVFSLSAGGADGGTGRGLVASQAAVARGRPPAPAPGAAISAPGPLAGLVRVLPVERLNALLVVTPRAHYLEQARLWIERFDRPADSESDKRLFVYEVQNGTASHIASVLNGVFGGGDSVSQATTRSEDPGIAPGLAEGSVGGSAALVPSARTARPADTTRVSLDDEVRVVADERNNALIIFASRREYRRIETALRQLDIAPTQVLIEASILEVKLTGELRYGLQWFFSNSLGGLGDGYQGSGQLTDNNLGLIGPRNPGFSYSISSPTGSFRAVLSALAQKSLLNVISTPTMMVLDNHTAVIRVGDQQPIRTSETTNLDGDNITSTIQYKDTGVLLEVSPSVNAGGMVSMDVRQSTTDVGEVDLATGQRAFLQRDLSSRVAVRSGETVILGGLIRDNSSRDRQGLPLLHDVPVLGHLFGATAVNTDRTELLVMITPRVIRTEQDLRDVSREFRDRMRSLRHLPGRVSGDDWTPDAVDAAFSRGLER